MDYGKIYDNFRVEFKVVSNSPGHEIVDGYRIPIVKKKKIEGVLALRDRQYPTKMEGDAKLITKASIRLCKGDKIVNKNWSGIVISEGKLLSGGFREWVMENTFG